MNAMKRIIVVRAKFAHIKPDSIDKLKSPKSWGGLYYSVLTPTQ